VTKYSKLLHKSRCI